MTYARPVTDERYVAERFGERSARDATCAGMEIVRQELDRIEEGT
jgi:hypothetical protein